MEDHGFLYYALILLSAAVLVVPLAKRSGLGAVLGYLVAGVIIGPYALKLINKPEAILHFSEFGVVMMLFLIGLELKPKTLWRLRKPIIGLGGSQVILTAAAFTACLMLMGLTWPVAVAIGAGLSLSSTAITLQLLNERNLLQTYAGQSSFAVLLFQDIAIIPILAMIPLLAASNSVGNMSDVITVVERQAGGSIWLKGIEVVGLVAAIGVIGHYGMRHLLRFIASTGIREIFTATALLLVISVTYLMQQVGLSPALGAFLAGVVLADSEYRHELENNIEPFKALLLGLFFISVGMSINFEVFLANWMPILGYVGGLIALKAIVLIGLMKLGKMDRSQGFLFAFVLAQGGEFAFVIFQFADQVNLLSPDLTSTLNVTVALSMLFSPLLMILHNRVIAPRFESFTEINPPKPTVIEQVNPVLIIGYGRFGTIVGRLLHANGIRATIIDHDTKQIDLMRRYGWKVYYGDATEIDLLEKAGIQHAKLVIMAIDDPDQAIQAVKGIKRAFPHVKILARAKDRRHAYELRKAGVDYYEREVFHSALSMSEEALKRLGYRAYAAKTLTRKFAIHDEKTLHQSFHFFEDEKRLTSFALQSRDDLEKVFEADRLDADLHRNEGWDDDHQKESR